MAKKKAVAVPAAWFAGGSRAPAASGSARAETREEFWYRVNLTRSRIANEQGRCSDPGALVAGLAAAIDSGLGATPETTHLVQTGAR